MLKTRVLLVDDEKSFTNLLKLNLEETGNYEVEVVNWPEDTLGVARKFNPDIILLDIIMPRMPGGNVAAEIQADEQLKDTPIVFLTAAVRRRQVEEAEGIICDLPCLAKPASLDEVIAMIEKHARRRTS
jgi:CheY-like chemotaxis protein